MATKKKECGYKLPKSGNPCGRTAKYGTSGAPRCKSHEGKRNKRGGNGPRPKKGKAIRKKAKKAVSKRGAATKKSRKLRKTKVSAKTRVKSKVKAKAKTTAKKTKTKSKKGKKRPHTKTKISFFDVKTGKNIMVPREKCKIKRNKSARGGDRVICMHKGRKYSTFVERGFKL